MFPVLLLLQTCGTFFFYKAQQAFVAFQMEELMEDEDLASEEIRLSASAYKNCRINKREIIIAGEMYDVRSVAVKGDTMILQAVHDADEDRINEKITKEGENNLTKKMPVQLIDLMMMVYTLPIQQDVSFFNTILAPSYRPHKQVFSDGCSGILTPPPKAVV